MYDELSLPSMSSPINRNSFNTAFFIDADDLIDMLKKTGQLQVPLFLFLSLSALRERKEKMSHQSSSLLPFSSHQTQFDKKKYEALLESPMKCNKCAQVLPNIPKLKGHLVSHA